MKRYQFSLAALLMTFATFAIGYALGFYTQTKVAIEYQTLVARLSGGGFCAHCGVGQPWGGRDLMHAENVTSAGTASQIIPHVDVPRCRMAWLNFLRSVEHPEAKCFIGGTITNVCEACWPTLSIEEQLTYMEKMWLARRIISSNCMMSREERLRTDTWQAEVARAIRTGRAKQGSPFPPWPELTTN